MNGLICGCERDKTPRRYLICKNCWKKLPLFLKKAVRPSFAGESVTGQLDGDPLEGLNNKQTLRARPTKAWIAMAKKVFRFSKEVASINATA
jgi:hypothetical protein